MLVGIAFLGVITVGIYGAISTGISADEEVEFNTYLLNLAAIKGVLLQDMTPYQTLMSYYDRYYGVGFHWVSHGLAGLMSTIGDPLLKFSQLGSRLIWAHVTNFMAFFVAAIIFRKSIYLLTHDHSISVLSMLTFLLWPYLLGHAFMNVKDIPFLLVWLICTYQLMKIFVYSIRLQSLSIYSIGLLGIFSGWLISVRVSGVLIFVQYCCFGVAWVAATYQKKTNGIDIKKVVTGVGILLSTTIVSVYFLYPILWHNPFELLNAIDYMSSHPWQGNTLTAGAFIEPKTRLVYYLFSWFLIKLPIIAILGLILLPIAGYRRMRMRTLSLECWVVIGILCSALSILGILIVKRVALYNELRQILFLFPLVMMIAIFSLFAISRRFLIGILLVTNLFMLIDDLHLHPYQYSYINEVWRHSPSSKSYETDYFGLSIAPSATWLNSSKVNRGQCIYVPSPHQWKHYLDRNQFSCLDGYPGDLSLIKSPFIFFVQPRGGERYLAPPWCILIHEEVRKPAFTSIELRMGELYECKP
jgi:hypothetical protein